MKTRQQLIQEHESEITKIYEQVVEEERSPESARAQLRCRFGVSEDSANQILREWPEILARRNALRGNL